MYTLQNVIFNSNDFLDDRGQLRRRTNGETSK